MAPQAKPRDTEGLVELVVVDDGLTYKLPRQKEPEPPKVYVTMPADRGDHIWVDPEDAERFLALGGAAKVDTPQAHLAKAIKHRTGTPFGAVAVNLGDNSAVDKQERLAVELGVIRAEGSSEGFDVVGTAADEPGAVRGDVPADFDAGDQDALRQLNTVQLKNLARQRSVEIESSDSKQDIVDKIHGSAKQQKPAGK